MPIQVRRATLEDAELLADFGAKTFRDTFAAYNTEADMASYLASSFDPAIQAGQLEDRYTTFLVAHIDGSTAGYAKLRFGEAPACVDGRKPVEIARFYADSPWIGHGVGSTLMDASLRLATEEDCDVVWLDVWSRNYRALAFYEKWGFAVVGNQDFQLGDDLQNDLLMARSTGGKRMDETTPDRVRIAMVADYGSGHPSHESANEALSHAADALGLALEVGWFPTSALGTDLSRGPLAGFDGIFAPGGEYENKDRGLEAIRFAREAGRPFFGT
jgi:diamine N-acetyltransferase